MAFVLLTRPLCHMQLAVTLWHLYMPLLIMGHRESSNRMLILAIQFPTLRSLSEYNAISGGNRRFSTLECY